MVDQLKQFLLSKVGIVPTPEQAEILACDKRFLLISGGEQAGKSLCAALTLFLRYPDDLNKAEAAGYPLPLVYWLVGNDYEATRREYEYVQTYFAAVGIPTFASKGIDPGIIEVYGGPRDHPITAIIRTKSAREPGNLRMESPSGTVGCEAAELDQETYYRIMARSGPRRGWVFLAGTFENSLGWYPGLYKAWLTGVPDAQSFRLPSHSNYHLYPGGRTDPEILRQERELPDNIFKERYLGEPAPPKGLVFGEFRPDLHIDPTVEYVPGVPVYVWVDPGYGHAYAVEVAQIISGQVRVFDEVYERGFTTREIISVVMQREWWKASVKFGVIDIAGRQHQAMPAPAEVWLAPPTEDGAGLFMASQRIGINEGNERLSSFLKVNPLTMRPGIVWSPKCKGVLSEFGAYPNPFDGSQKVYRWKTNNDGDPAGDVPDDRNNDGLKATIYGLVDKFGFARALRDSNKILMKRF